MTVTNIPSKVKIFYNKSQTRTLKRQKFRSQLTTNKYLSPPRAPILPSNGISLGQTQMERCKQSVNVIKLSHPSAINPPLLTPFHSLSFVITLIRTTLSFFLQSGGAETACKCKYVFVRGWAGARPSAPSWVCLD